MIKNIIFDIGGVLVDFRPREAMRRIGISEEKIPALLDATVCSPLWVELDRGALPEKEVISRMSAQYPELSSEINSFFQKGIKYLVKSCDYATEWLRDYKMRGYKLYLLSNYPSSCFELHCRENLFTFLELTEGRIVSGYVKQIKPERGIYETLLSSYGLTAGECVFIDDRADNVQAAREAGLHALRFTEFEETCRRLEPLLRKQ